MDEKFVKAVIRVALLYTAARTGNFLASGIQPVAKEWEKWVWGEKDGSITKD